MKKNLFLILYCCTFIILLAVFIMTALTMHRMPQVCQNMQKKVDILEELYNLAKIRERDKAAIKTFEALPETSPVSITALVASYMPNVKPEIRLRNVRKLFNGWTVKEVEIIFGSVRLNKLPPFLFAAESQSLPWRLKACHITATSSVAESGRVELLMEALEKKQSTVQNSMQAPGRQ